jgi:outer membrane protein
MERKMSKMLRMTRTGFRLLLVAFGIVLCATAAHAQSGKIGWIDLDRILNEYPEFQEAEALFEKDAVLWEADFDSLQTEYFDRLEDYRRQRLLLSEPSRKEREQELATMEQNLMETKLRLEQEAERRRAELTTPILQKIQDVVQQVAVNEDYDYVMNSSMIYRTPGGIQFSPIMYAKDRLDLTDRVFEELNKLR